MPVLTLDNVMLCAVSSIAIPETVHALTASAARIRFGDVAFFTDAAPPTTPNPLLRWVTMAPLRSKEAYSHFMLKELGARATRPFVLVVQWDGYVINAERWNPAFLEVDYIGAPWPQFADGRTVGNGGFSLRSARLLQALADPALPLAHPEDVAICRDWRPFLEEKYQIRFADPELAASFAVERSGDLRRAFGFHGMFHLPDLLSREALHAFANSFPAGGLQGADAADFLRRLAMLGERQLAWALWKRRMQASGWDRKQVKLLRDLMMHMMRAPAPRGSLPPWCTLSTSVG